jgi:hypothetical protein
MTQGVGPEFKPQYYKKNEKKQKQNKKQKPTAPKPGHQCLIMYRSSLNLFIKP